MIWKMLAGLVLVVVVVCSASAAERVAKVAVFSSGSVQLDGRPTTLPALDEELKKLKADNGVGQYVGPARLLGLRRRERRVAPPIPVASSGWRSAARWPGRG